MTAEYVLACIHPPSVWNFFPTLEAAAAKRDEANTYQAHDTTKRDYQAMTYDAYKASERAFYLGDAPTQITAEKYHEMLEVLPPKCWQQRGDFESFLMIEHWSGPYTHQYASRGDGTYWEKMVDATDRSTWMQPEVK